MEHYVYDAFGALTVLTGAWGARASSSYAWKYLHQGGRWDADGGLYSFRNREYSPTLGRWVQMDPIGFESQENNLYVFVNNRPTIQVDFSGLLAIFFEGAGQDPEEGSQLVIYRLFKKVDDESLYYKVPIMYNNARGNSMDAVKRIIAYNKAHPCEKIDLFGWSRGAVSAVLVSEELIKMKSKINIRFMGLIDPVNRGLNGGSSKSDGWLFNVRTLWLGVRDGNYNTADRVFFPKWDVVNATLYSKSLYVKYKMSHSDTGFDDNVYNDLLSAAKNAGVKFKD